MIEFRGLSLFTEKVGRSSLGEQFKKVALLFQGAKYKMGSENLDECDCSGLVCSTLIFLGYTIRITADEIMKKLTTSEIPLEPNRVRLVGCKKEGKYKHIGIVMENGEDTVIYNASYPTGTQFESKEKFESRYRNRGYSIDYAFLSWDKVEKMDGVAYGLDKEVKL